MQRLYILRHGIALPHGTPDLADDDRPLTPKGEARLRTSGQALRRLRVEPERVVTSPLPRAQRTAEIVAAALGIGDRLEIADALRSGVAAESVRTWLGSRPEVSLMIVGHDPTFSDLIGLLIGVAEPGSAFALKKGGIAALDAVGESRWTLRWLLTPRVMRSFHG